MWHWTAYPEPLTPHTTCHAYCGLLADPELLAALYCMPDLDKVRLKILNPCADKNSSRRRQKFWGRDILGVESTLSHPILSESLPTLNHALAGQEVVVDPRHIFAYSWAQKWVGYFFFQYLSYYLYMALNLYSLAPPESPRLTAVHYITVWSSGKTVT